MNKLQISADPGDISFHTRDVRNVLVIKSDGSFLVHGRKVTEDREVFEAMKGWISSLSTIEQHGRVVRALGNMLTAFDSADDALVLDRGGTPSDKTRNEDPLVAEARQVHTDAVAKLG